VCSVLLALFVSLRAPMCEGLEVRREFSVLVSGRHFQLCLTEIDPFGEVSSGEFRGSILRGKEKQRASRRVASRSG
jgi:hypothetical protein